MTDRRPTLVARIRNLERKVEILTEEFNRLSDFGANTRSLVKDTLREYEFLDTREQNSDGGVVPPSAHNAKTL